MLQMVMSILGHSRTILWRPFTYIKKCDGRSAFLLQLWDMLELHELMGSSIQRLSEGIGSGNGDTGVPPVIGSKERVFMMMIPLQV